MASDSKAVAMTMFFIIHYGHNCIYRLGYVFVGVDDDFKERRPFSWHRSYPARRRWVIC